MTLSARATLVVSDPIDGIQAKYMNDFQVGHNALEFVLEFGLVAPEEAVGRMHTRLLASPICAKLLSSLLLDSIHQYEAKFGVIPAADEPQEGV